MKLQSPVEAANQPRWSIVLREEAFTMPVNNRLRFWVARRLFGQRLILDLLELALFTEPTGPTPQQRVARKVCTHIGLDVAAFGYVHP